jgi:hypothetical protein
VIYRGKFINFIEEEQQGLGTAGSEMLKQKNEKVRKS